MCKLHIQFSKRVCQYHYRYSKNTETCFKIKMTATGKRISTPALRFGKNSKLFDT
jgi:hypothetical protein